MDLSKYEFPKITQLDLAFSTTKTDPVLLDEAIKRNPKKGIEKFNELFYSGGKIELQKDVQGTWKENAYLYAISLMSSWDPKHEDKTIVCAMLFEETLKL
jgi:hypothetical protein